MTFDDLMRKILDVLPDAVMEEDNYGQIIIYTGMQEILDEDGRHIVVPFEEDEDI